MIHMCVASKPRSALMRVCSARPKGAQQEVLTNKHSLPHKVSPRSAMSAAKLGTRSDRSVGLELGLARRGLDAREGRDVVVEDVLDDDPRPRLALRQVVVEFRRDLAHLRDRATCHLPAYRTARLPMGSHPCPLRVWGGERPSVGCARRCWGSRGARCGTQRCTPHN